MTAALPLMMTLVMALILLAPALLFTACIALVAGGLTKPFSASARSAAAIISGLIAPVYFAGRGLYLAYPWPLEEQPHSSDAWLSGQLLCLFAIFFVVPCEMLSFRLIRRRSAQ